MENKKYDFGEKTEENISGKKMPVEFLTPKFKEARKKAIELLESKEYKGILLESDFWILVNTYSNKSKAMYSGLIISHDGCLKINDALEESKKFKPECVKVDKDGYKNSLTFSYMNEEQGLYEVGEINSDNCKNDYPYAMALKRCFDRVVLKNSKIAYSGIYSDSESDEFIKKNDDINNKEIKPKVKTEIKATANQIAILLKNYTGDNLKKLLEVNNLEKIEDITLKKASDLISKLSKKEEK